MVIEKEIGSRYRNLACESSVETIIDGLKLPGFLLSGRLLDLKHEAEEIIVSVEGGKASGKHVGTPKHVARSTDGETYLLVQCPDGSWHSIASGKHVRWDLLV